MRMPDLLASGKLESQTSDRCQGQSLEQGPSVRGQEHQLATSVWVTVPRSDFPGRPLRALGWGAMHLQKGA